MDGGLGNDNLTVDSTAGPVTVPITYDGGTGNNSLTLQGGTALSDTYTPGPGPGAGVNQLEFAGGTETVYFQNLAPVLDLVAGPLVVNGTPADDAINYTQGSVAANGLVTIDNFESIEFSNKTALTINGLAGSDEINLNNPSTPTGLTTITVNGGDPTGSDTLIMNSVGHNLVLEPTALGAGTVNYFSSSLPSTPFTGIESLELVDTSTSPFGIDGTTGNDQFEYIPGATPDTGTVVGTMNSGAAQFPLVPVTFRGMQQAGVVVFNAFGQQGGTDSFIFNGTPANDHISVVNGGVFGGITLSDTVNGSLFANLNLNNMASGVVRGLDGDDTFNQTGGVAVAMTYEGGNPSASDVLNLSGATGAVTVNLADSTLPTDTTITGYGGTVTLTGVEVANLDGNGNALTVNGTAGPDSLAYTPTGTAAGTVTLAGLNLVTNFTNVAAAFTIDPGAGADTVTVNGTSANDAITVVRGATNDTVQVNALQTVTLVNADTQSLVVATGAGIDGTTVSGSGGPVVTVQGGQTPASDNLTVNNTVASGNTTVTPGAANDSGTVANTDGTIKFSGMTLVTVNDNVASTIDILTVNGTNGDDAITAAHVGANNLVWVNSQAVVAFTNFNQLTLAGRFGSDFTTVSPVGLTLVGATPQINVTDAVLMPARCR